LKEIGEQALSRASYSTDLKDAEWGLLEGIVPKPKPGGGSAKYERREMVKAMVNVVQTGWAWRLRPHDVPPYRSVFYYSRQWRKAGLFETLNAVLRGRVREQAGRNRQASAAVLDSQSVKTTEKGAAKASMQASW
jgi:putative transposase